jgi:glycerophosphoryl diester phosphodiesterase
MPQLSAAGQAFFDTEGPIAIAHRGGDGAGFNKRNTMAAFRSAYDLGYRYFETDVVATKDGEVIVSHGARTKLGARLRGTFTFQVLQSMGYKDIQKNLKIDGEPIPLLSEVLEAFPDVHFIIDPKTEEAVEPLARLINQSRAYRHVLVGSFYYARVKRLSELIGKEKVYTKLTVGRFSGFLRLSSVWFRKVLRLSGRYHPAKVNVYEVPHWFISRAMVVEAHREGRKLIAWTPNRRQGIQRLLNKSVDGVMSDRAELLKEVILARDPTNKSFRQDPKA